MKGETTPHQEVADRTVSQHSIEACEHGPGQQRAQTLPTAQLHGAAGKRLGLALKTAN